MSNGFDVADSSCSKCLLRITDTDDCCTGIPGDEAMTVLIICCCTAVISDGGLDNGYGGGCRYPFCDVSPGTQSLFGVDGIGWLVQCHSW